MSKLKVYLSGAMEAYDGTEKAKEWREYCKSFLVNCDGSFAVFSPTDHYQYGINYHKNNHEIFRYDLYQTRTSDIVLVNLNDVRKSIGTCMELYEAHKSGIPVVGFIDDDISGEELIQKIHPWVYCCVDRIETGEDGLYKALDYIIEFYGD